MPIFDNRLQWDSAEGPQPVDARPNIDKQVARVDLQSAFGDVDWSLGGVCSETENQLTGLASDHPGLVATLGRSFEGGWSLRWRGRGYSLENDEVFVDTVERLSIAGPHAGLTFRDVYGFDPDLLRLSALDRDVFESRFDASYRLGGRKAGRIKLLWELERIEREHFEVAPGETDTTTNVLGASWRGRPAKGWKLEAGLRHGEVDNPFVNLDGVFSTNTGPRVSSPFAPDSEQYFEFQDARIGDATASPESWDELDLRVTRTLSDSLVTGTYRYWDGESSTGDLTDWSRSYQAATLSIWSTPAPEWEWFVSVARHDSELEAPASIPLFDG